MVWHYKSYGSLPLPSSLRWEGIPAFCGSVGKTRWWLGNPCPLPWATESVLSLIGTMEGFVVGARCFIVPTFSLANGKVFESTLDADTMESELEVESFLLSSCEICWTLGEFWTWGFDWAVVVTWLRTGGLWVTFGKAGTWGDGEFSVTGFRTGALYVNEFGFSVELLMLLVEEFPFVEDCPNLPIPLSSAGVFSSLLGMP